MSRIRTKTGGLPYARYQLQRSILETALENDYSSEDREEALEFFGGCAYCGDMPAPRNDHLIPVFQCGDFVRHNVVPACQPCDDSKGQKEYHEWMRNSNSPRSLKHRKKFTTKEIERRIRRIEAWQAGYKAKTEEQLFGNSFGRYKEILRAMDALCEDARELVNNIKTESKVVTATHLKKPQTVDNGTMADKIRQYVADNYVRPARSRGEKTIIIRSGEVHAQMRLHQRHANVCQTLKGDKLQKMASIKLLSVKGPPAGGNTYYKYQL